MTTQETTERVCEQGHRFYKSSDCPTCPVCEQQSKPSDGFLSLLSNPARQALEHEGITTLQRLSDFTEREILRLHGMGPRSMPILRDALLSEGLSFKPGKSNKT